MPESLIVCADCAVFIVNDALPESEARAQRILDRTREYALDGQYLILDFASEEGEVSRECQLCNGKRQVGTFYRASVHSRNRRDG